MFRKHQTFADKVRSNVETAAAAAVGSFLLGVAWSGAKLAAQRGLSALQAPVEPAPKKAEAK